MPEQEQIKSLTDKLEKVQEKQQFLQNLAWVLGAVAIALGVGGNELNSQLGNMKSEAATLREDLDGLRRLHTELDKDLSDRVETTLSPAIAAALLAIENQESLSTASIRNQILKDRECARLAELQVCWGAIKGVIDSTNPHTATFSANFQRPFKKPPMVLASPAMKSSGHMVGIYSWSATESTYSGRLNNTYRNPGQPPVHLSGDVSLTYLAIGEPTAQ